MAKDLKLLVFKQGGTVWGLPVGNISEVIVEPEIFPIPQPRVNVSGLVVYRGQPAVAMTLSEKIDKPFKYGIVIRSGAQYKVLLNDEPGSLLDIDASGLSAYDGDFGYVRATLKNNGDAVLIIDPRRLSKIGIEK